MVIVMVMSYSLIIMLIDFFFLKSFLLLLKIIVISNMLYMLEASNWNLKVETMTETTLYEILWHYKRKVTNEKNLLVNLIVNLITKYHKLF